MKDFDVLDGDLRFENGDIAFVSGADQVRQRVLIRLRRSLGEWAYNIRLGLPWIEQILVKNPDLATIRSLLLAEIIATPGVLQVRALELELTAERQLVFTWSALVEDDAGASEFIDGSTVDFDSGELQFLLEPIGVI
jgi:hypothetical protein